jgi:hypothetical protein
MSWAPEVQTDSTGKWYGNALRFPTKEEAEAQVKDLAWRWTSVLETRVVESEDPPNYQYVDGSLLPYSAVAQSLLLDEQQGTLKRGERKKGW